MPGVAGHARGYALAAAIAMIAAFAAASWSFYNGRRATCEARDVTLSVVRDVLQLTEPPENELAQLPDGQRARVLLFYVSAYERIEEASC